MDLNKTKNGYLLLPERLKIYFQTIGGWKKPDKKKQKGAIDWFGAMQICFEKNSHPKGSI